MKLKPISSSRPDNRNIDSSDQLMSVNYMHYRIISQCEHSISRSTTFTSHQNHPMLIPIFILYCFIVNCFRCIILYVHAICTTSNVTGHTEVRSECFRLVTVLSLQCTSYLCELLLCKASSVFHRRVWYHTLSLHSCTLCSYSTFGHHPHQLAYPCAKFHFCCTLIAELARGEKSDTQ